MNILIIDDMAENRKLLGSILQPYGDLSMASTGQGAVELFEASLLEDNPFDLVMLDIMMPVMNGHEVLEAMRRIERENGVPVGEASIIFMITAVDSPDSMVRAYAEGGCDDYISKPVLPRTIIDKLVEFDLIEPS